MNHGVIHRLLIAASCLLLLLPHASFAGRVMNDSLTTRPFRHHVWQDVLTRTVNARGEVDFASLRAYPRRLNDYLAQLESVSPESDPTYFPTRNDQVAYWINAHNAIALRIVLDHYPARSTARIPNFTTMTHYRLGNKPYSLIQIRNKLGKSAKRNPKLLFALTDYTRSAPPILPDAYEGNTLKTRIEQAMQHTLKDRYLVQVRNRSGHCAELAISPFFRTYEKALFSPTAADLEDHDILSEEGMVPVATLNWQSFLRPFAPPDAYARMGPECGSQTSFLPENKTLREVDP